MSWESLHRLGPDTIAVVAPGQEARIIHREDADPEHRLPAYRAAAILFGNLPQEPVPTDHPGLRTVTIAVDGRVAALVASRGLVHYVSDGGTYLIGTPSRIVDDPTGVHDLVAVLPEPVEGSRVLVLRTTVDPELVEALREVLDR